MPTRRSCRSRWLTPHDGEPGAGVGARFRRKEDARFLHGHGEFVGDITPAGMLEVAFVRSPSRTRGSAAITKPAGPGSAVFTARRPRRRATDPRRLRAAGLQAPPSSRRWRAARCATSASRSRCASPPTRAEAEDLRRPGRARLRGAARGASTCSARTEPARRWCTRTGATTSSSRRCVDDDLIAASSGDAARSTCARHRAPRASAWRRSKAAAWSASGTAGSSQLVMHTRDADAAHQPRRPGRMPRPRPGPDPRHLARRRRRLRLQGHPAARGESASRWLRRSARPAGALDRGSPRAADRRTPTAASTTTTSPLYADRDGRLLGRRLRRHGRFRRLFVLSVLAPAWKPRRSARSCPGPT